MSGKCLIEEKKLSHLQVSHLLGFVKTLKVAPAHGTICKPNRPYLFSLKLKNLEVAKIVKIEYIIEPFKIFGMKLFFKFSLEVNFLKSVPNSCTTLCPTFLMLFY